MTGECGDAREALRCSRRCCPQERVLGADHPDTLRTRNNIAAGPAECGDAREALRLFQALLPDRSACSAPITRTRSRPATTSLLDRPMRRCARGAALFQALLPDRERVLGADHPDTLGTHNRIRYWQERDTDDLISSIIHALIPGATSSPD